MNPKHTPWIANGTEINGDEGRLVIGEASIDVATDRKTAEAHAKLMAAAPDLLDVALNFRAFARPGSPYQYPLGGVQQLDAAIAKATQA